MATVKEHYDNHLGNIYSWMIGDFIENQNKQEEFFRNFDIFPHSTGIAIDLGAGNGIQSIALAKLGFKVISIDFNAQLLSELTKRKENYPIKVIEDFLNNVKNYQSSNPELITCCGDTITHLESKADIFKLIEDCHKILSNQGKIILTFRDYTKEVKGNDRFIPLRSDDSQILTCFVEYFPDYVRVTDLLYKLENESWNQYLSSYYKVRITPEEVAMYLEETGFTILRRDVINRMFSIIAQKQS